MIACSLEKQWSISLSTMPTREHIPLSNLITDAVVNFRREDGISRTSSNSKDPIKSNGQSVALQFLEMTVLDTYQISNERNPRTVARSSFSALPPNETCMCIIHEDMDLLLRFCISFILIRM